MAIDGHVAPQQQADALAEAGALKERLTNDLVASMGLLQVYIGHKLGLFQALAELDRPVAPEQLAAATGLQERYVREWLCACAVNGFVHHNPERNPANLTRIACPLDLGTFSLTPGGKIAFTDKESPAYAAPLSLAGPILGQTMPQLLKAFREGGGVPYEAYGGDFREMVADLNGPTFKAELASQWVPALGGDLTEKLTKGGVVVDVGCGHGHSLVALAKAFPKAHVVGLDLDEASVEAAEKVIKEAGLEGHVAVHRVFAHEAREKIPELKDGADLISMFQCLHDMHNQVEVLTSLRELAKAKEGVVLLGDFKCGDTLQDALPGSGDVMANFLAKLNYTFSVTHCLPQAMVYPESSGVGTCLAPRQLGEFAKQAGWGGVEAVPCENTLWHFYRFVWKESATRSTV